MRDAAVVDIPVRYRRPRRIRAREIHAEPEPSDLMVWELCPYIGWKENMEQGCQQCPKWENHPNHGLIKRGCRMAAEEACRIVMAVQRIERQEGGDDA